MNDVNEFILTNKDKYFILSCNGNIVSEKMFIKESEAIAYYKAFITSFSRSILTIETRPIKKLKFGR